MIANIQDEDLAKQDLRDQERLAQMRSAWENSWQEIDERFPATAGFTHHTPGQMRGARNFDSQHILSLHKFRAAGVAITSACAALTSAREALELPRRRHCANRSLSWNGLSSWNA